MSTFDGYEVTVFFVKSDLSTPIPVFWSESPALQGLSKMFFQLTRDKFANTTEITLSVPSEITVKEFLADLQDRGVISEREVKHSKVLVELSADQPLFGRLVRDGTKFFVVLRSFALNPV